MMTVCCLHVQGDTALKYAVEEKHTEVERMLLKAGALMEGKKE